MTKSTTELASEVIANQQALKNAEPCTIKSKKDGKEYTWVLYKDFLTFKRWQAIWKLVKKWEKSCYSSISWIPTEKVSKKTGKITKSVYPKKYNLFHISQVA